MGDRGEWKWSDTRCDVQQTDSDSDSNSNYLRYWMKGGREVALSCWDMDQVEGEGHVMCGDM
jgi:hypothetical protein